MRTSSNCHCGGIGSCANVLRDANPSKSKNSAIAVNFFISNLLSLVVGVRAHIQNDCDRENVPQRMCEKRGKNGLADQASRAGIVPLCDFERDTLQIGLFYGLIITSSVSTLPIKYLYRQQESRPRQTPGLE